ncbi:hypothetical protein X755_01240 [Mesorhizobium sp. LNJC405B00]|nr:hypothetical protein X755_01240 [Mesorhizobium sp. LNJC405B00]
MSAATAISRAPASSQILDAAHWLATGGADRTKAVVPQMQERFGLSASDACEAVREANLIRARAT